MQLAIIGAALLASLANAFYLPGAAPRNYHRGEKVELFVNALTPMLAGKENPTLVRAYPSRSTSWR
jgi:transmembrane 9 superfamily member 2/4